jgi:Spy/CpxP family protein refolding chaperone
MTRFRSLTVGVLLTGLLASGAAFAQGPGRPGGPGGRGGRGPGGPGGPVDLPLVQLNLTEAQRQQIRDLSQRRLEAGKAVQERLRAAMDARRVAVNTLPVNEGAIRSTTADLVAAETEAAILQAHLRADIVALLTPEQQDQLKKVEAQRESRVDARRERVDNRREQRQQKPR